MELREWLIILGLALVTLIVVDGVRRLQRQRRVPRLDEVAEETRGTDPDEQAREAEINWELPNGGARVVRPADYSQVQPKPKLERQEHPGPSRVLASFRRKAEAFRSDGEAPAAKREPGLGVGEGVADTPADAKAADAKAADAKAAKVKVAKARKDEPVAAASVASVEPAAAAPAEPVQAESTPLDAVQPEPAKAEPDQAETVKAEPVKAESAQAEPPRPKAADPLQAERREPGLSALDDDAVLAVGTDEPLAADPDDHDGHPQDDERYRLVDLEGMGDSLKSGSRRVGASVQRFGASLQKTLAERREQKRLEKARREKEKAEKAALDAEHQRLAREQAEAERAALEAERRRLEAQAIAEADDNDPLFAPPRARRSEPADVEYEYEYDTARADDLRDPEPDLAPALNSDKVRVHPVLEKALRHDVSAGHARETLSAASELIVISVMSRDEEGFSGAALLDLMLACGLRYDRDMGVFHRFETEDPESRLQFSMVNVVKPGSFPIKAMDEFRTPGITLLMPLPGADDPSAAFEAMVETAMVIVRHLGGELKDENHSVMTAQTVGFARQRVQEFVRRHRLHRYQVN
ncbi:cell division protein ZipA [Halomonas alkalicola]|uniref:Cell division protein ZipA n=1 Tax=Halomonas alkalicola TaxID=1930622 RepID=A0ABY9H2B6_9GAMM|nr:cell division protein ZipA [Halomonas alkalicola]WLI72605.1 cell division protein ZipA [Halomonas alkalicola]